MKILHVVKTAEGADWAAREVTELVRAGHEIHVVVPQGSTQALKKWTQSGAMIHHANFDFPVKAPWRLALLLPQVRALVKQVQPDLIHSHFFGTSLVLRYALGKTHPIPRLFQVPGPLHLEHSLFKSWELSSAGESDFWIASSQYIQNLYLEAGLKPDRVFLSYYGLPLPQTQTPRTHSLHKALSLNPTQKIIGNVSYIYKPKYYLGQTRGIKNHEILIDAIAEVTRTRSDVTGVLIGGAWKGAEAYENRLKRRALTSAGDRIRMLGKVSSQAVLSFWPDFDLAIHIPRSENCGGVVEPLLSNVPVIASRVGGLPEVILDGVTGTLVSGTNVSELVQAIHDSLNRLPEARMRAAQGREHVKKIFDLKKTASEIQKIYEMVLQNPRGVHAQ